SMSRRLGAVFVANLEHLSKYFSNRGQGIELPALDFVEQPAKLRVVRDRALEMRLRARRGNRQDLAGQVLAAVLLEQALGLEEPAVLLDLLPQLGHVLATRRLGEDDRRAPGALLVERE